MTPTRFLALVCTFLAFLFAPLYGSAQDQDQPEVSTGGHGTPFFLLSDASYGSGDKAMVRLEALDMGPVSDYGGVDVYVYRVKKPLDFLKAQKNLHRIDTEADYVGPGLSNAISRTWDNWWTGSRKAWQGLFTSDARQAMTAQAPELHTHPLVKAETPQVLNPQYRPLKMHTLVDSFRYPVHLAKPIQPPAGVKLDGSSSEFIASPQGNVMIPLGKKEPGLYLVEAMVGDHRAVTLVFVSDTIAVTKVSAQQMLVWTADRRNGSPVADAQTVWSDGVGVLASGKSDASGLTTFNRAAPEKTVLYGEDAQGGVYVAENYYYDSEIYNTKLYAVTDRPMYRPGETVFVKFLGREFHSARESTPVAAADIKLQVFDAGGFPVAGQTLHMSPDTGGDTSFQLPDNAVAGGYELRFSYKGDVYGAAFRVAEYQKPHFEINILPSKNDFKTNEDVKGQVQLVYPDGKPVANATAELSVRAQRLTMIEGDLGYAGQFPLQLSTAKLSTDSKGMASFKLPAAKEPSRYVLTVLATDGAAYKVRATKEILVERGAGTYTVKSERAFSGAGEKVDFSYRLLNDGHSAPDAANNQPASWDWVRLENRKRANGTVAAGGKFAITFAEPGTYTVSLRDAAGNIVGGTSHYVSGAGVGAPQGSIEMVFDKTSYKPGETASALVTFPQPVDQALFTLERDAVEKTALMTNASGWANAKRLSPTQWRVDIPVADSYGPNITFSVVYVKGGEYVFQNLGLKVEQPRIDIAVQADKTVYAPGETVTLDLAALVGGKPAPGTILTVGVVDEMVYVLQPEIAPNIQDFFYHPRRNNVRTSASLNFIGYDLAKPPGKLALPARGQTHERAIKLLERPRREDKDTAFWQPTVKVDATGHAKVTFTMPDSLTRWRVTVRALSVSGEVGQNLAYVRSDKDFYVKWTSPDWMRVQDAPVASVAIFNEGNKEAKLELSATGAGLKKHDALTVKPGANFVPLPLSAAAGDSHIDLALTQNGKTVDALTVPLKVVPLHWQSQRSQSIALTGKETALKLPADAANVRLQFTDGASAEFHRMMDDLIDYPYGCVEQTSSRLIPYSLALQSALPSDERMVSQLTQRLNSYRFRLAQMAGPEATFGWWSMPERDADPLLTAYAYYADWHASRALKLTLPDGHFDRLIEVYRKDGIKRSAWERALMLYWMQDMGLPVRSLAEGLLDETTRIAANPAAKAARLSAMNSLMLAQDEDDLQTAMARILTAYVVQQSQGTVSPDAKATLDAAAQRVQQANLPLADALLMLTGRRPAADAAAILDNVRAEYPTFDRAMTLLWTYRALGGNVLRGAAARIEPDAPWQAADTATGQRVYRWPAGTALPAAIKLASAPAAGLTAVAQYESREPETSSLPVHLERRLYRLVKSEDKPAAKDAAKAKAGSAPAATVAAADINSYTLELLEPNAVLKTDEVYLDEVVLRHDGAPLRFGILEVPLPPGTNADRTTWGIAVRFPGAQAAEALEKARYEQTPRGYAVPVDSLSGEMVIRHLVRASQTGTFALPPARYYRMYQPEQKAFEERARARIEIR
ncbi:MAG TPA: alpha-2-macroglobulin [Burkholderiaceae bacterium]